MEKSPRHRERPIKADPPPDHNTSLRDVLMKIERMKIADILPAERPVRRHSEKKIQKLAASISRLGCLSPIIVGPENRIINGHAVLEACRLAGMSEVPVVRHEHLSAAEALRPSIH